MGIPGKYKAPFIENGIYHVYNSTNNKELLFRNDENRIFFLKKFDLYALPFLDVFSWNLLPNHFHLCVKIKPYDEISDYLNTRCSKELCLSEKKFLQQKTTVHQLLENVFKRFFVSYAMSFNNLYNRKGNLFHRPFKHIRVNKDSQFTQTVIYINANAIKHNLVKKIEEYKWSSYNSILSDKPTKLLRKELLNWLGGRAQFIKLHKEQTAYYYSCDASLDDD